MTAPSTVLVADHPSGLATIADTATVPALSAPSSRDYFPKARVMTTRPPADAPTLLDAVKAWAVDWDCEEGE